MHIRFTKTTDCDFPATTFKQGKTYSMPEPLAKRFIEAGQAEAMQAPSPRQKSQPLTDAPQTPTVPDLITDLDA